MRFKSFFVFLGIMFFVFDLQGQNIQNIGVPYVENYAKSTYQAGNQNWSITQDEHGIFYFGNSEGLLSFDGKFWQTHQIPHHLIVRSVAADKKGKIYTEI